MVSSIRELKTFDDVNNFLILKEGVGKRTSTISLGAWGGRRFKSPRTNEHFSMNEIVKKLVTITKVTINNGENVNFELAKLDKIIKHLNKIDKAGYQYSQNKNDDIKISYFKRLLTTIKQGFGISKLVRKKLYHDIASLQNKYRKLQEEINNPM